MSISFLVFFDESKKHRVHCPMEPLTRAYTWTSKVFFYYLFLPQDVLLNSRGRGSTSGSHF